MTVLPVAAGDTPFISRGTSSRGRFAVRPPWQPVARFRVASTPGFRDRCYGIVEDGEGLCMTVQHLAAACGERLESLQRGSRVVRGRPSQAAELMRQRNVKAHRLRGGSGRRRRLAQVRLRQVT